MEIRNEKEKISIDLYADRFTENYHNQAMKRNGMELSRFEFEFDFGVEN